MTVGAHLYLFDSEVKEGVLIPNSYQTFRAFTAHAGSQTSIQLDDDQLVEDRCDVIW